MVMQTLASGQRRIVALTFAVASDANAATVSFSDLPVAREVDEK